MVSVRMVTAAAPHFPGVDWLMVTMLTPAALMPASRLCGAPVSSRNIYAITVMTSRPFSESKMQSPYTYRRRCGTKSTLPVAAEMLRASPLARSSLALTTLRKTSGQDLCVHQIKAAFQLVHLTNTSVLAENIITSGPLHCKRPDVLADCPVLMREVTGHPATGSNLVKRCSRGFPVRSCSGLVVSGSTVCATMPEEWE